ncbi:hypothetical protein [Skermania piniformis]|uniref:DNA-binding protein n=1 Tax=Skermania pinensis TaxID=39122 RepID=A0ABX8SBP2_9ACTN|nr:hypothetical protein [Skermania piniformis]QXQ14876.1 DNA-binding protein [Skermania piniformis]
MTAACDRCGRSSPRLRRGLCAACYGTRRERDIAYGRWESQRVPADPVRAHVAALRAAGMSLAVIRARAGVSRTALSALRLGRPERGTPPPAYVMAGTARAVLAVPIPGDPAQVAARGALVDATGARRRLRALVAAGWTHTELAHRLGTTVSHVGRTLHADRVTARRADDIAKLYAELQMRPGPSVRARRHAARHDWPLPLEWDEDTIDDPDTEPVRSRHTAASTRRERIERVAELTAAGLSAKRIADRLGVTQRAVTRYRRAGAVA